MAKKKPSGRPFQKGNTSSVGNRGRKANPVPAYDADELANRKIDNAFINRYITMNSHLSEEQLLAKINDKTISIFEKRIIKSLLGLNSDLTMNQIIERLAGKVAEHHIHEARTNKYEQMSLEELQAEKERRQIATRERLTEAETICGLRTPEQTTNEQAPRDVSEIDKEKSD